MNQSRTVIFKSPYYQDAFDALEKLEALYLKIFKKSLSVELYFSSQGEKPNALYSVTVYYENKPDHIVQLEWLKNTINQ